VERVDRRKRGTVRRAQALVAAVVQYDVCRVVGLRSGSAVDIAVVLQDDQLSAIATRIVAPLIDVDERYVVDRAAPLVEIDGARYVVAVHLLTTLPVRNLSKPITNLRDHEQTLKNAIDTVLFGV
jgi:toxin CcdB